MSTMKYLTKTSSFIAALVLGLCLQAANAQSNIDANRMQRDINIMESVLQEMFKTRWAAHGNTVRVHAGQAFFGRGRDIQGTYLPDYGVIFTIPGGPPAFVSYSNSEEEAFSYHFSYGDSDEGEKVSRESITDKIVEFLSEYGSTMGQLSGNEKLTVIYHPNSEGPRLAVFTLNSDSEKQRQTLPTISVTASRKDLGAYRSGSIDREELRDRLDISVTEDGEQSPRDLKVMAGIFETAFKDNSSKKSFRITGPVNHLKLDSFGALFSFDARYAESGGWGFSGIHESLEVFRNELKDARAEVEMEMEIKEKIDKRDSLRAVRKKEVDSKKAERREQLGKAYEQFLSDLKEYLVDYGRTLNSVDADQRIMVTVNFSTRLEEIPEQLHLQIRKSRLTAMDRGKISREEAMAEIQVREQ